MIHLYLFINALKKAVNLNFSCLPQSLITCVLIGKPDLPRPKTCSPIIIFNRLIKLSLAVSLLELIGKYRKIPHHLLLGKAKRLAYFLVRDTRHIFK